jgi:hypothetical protein
VRRFGAAAGLAIALLLVLAMLATTAIAASPAPTTVAGGDPRSAGEGPGLVGTPVVAIGLVFAIGIGAALVTLAWVRLTGGPGKPD